jgi:hypothetical protein
LIGLRVGGARAASPTKRTAKQECEDTRFHSSY